jgi:putative nucleotidyltransferase with HDIG domain
MNNKNKIYDRALEWVDKYCSGDPTHRTDHSIRVLHLVEYLAKKENSLSRIDIESLKLAAIFHDLGSGHRIKKLKKSSDKFKAEEHSEQGFKIAKQFLVKEGFSKTEIEKIQKIITSHGTDGLNIDIEGKFLHDADLLDGLGLAGVLRIFTFGGQIGRDVLGSLEFIKSKIKNRQFRTVAGRSIGQKRNKKVLKWLTEVEKELQQHDLI